MRRLFLLAGLTAAAPVLAVPTGVTAFELPLPGTTAASEPDLAGTVLSDTLAPFAIASASAPVSGTVQVRVVRNASGKLAFYWKINNSAASKGAVHSLSFTGFPKKAYDSNWRVDGLGTVAPSTVAGNISAVDLKTWIIGFRFKTPVKPGESSRFFFLRGEATASVPAVGHVGGSDGFANVPVLAPSG
jgi:hypothetical protein